MTIRNSGPEYNYVDNSLSSVDNGINSVDKEVNSVDNSINSIINGDITAISDYEKINW